MLEKINNAQLSFTCNKDWNTMESEEDGRFCNTCQKKVYDMTNKNAAYFIRIMQENNNKACGRFTHDQLAKYSNESTPSESVNRPYWKSWIVTAIVFMGFGTVEQKASAQTILGKVAPKPIDSTCDSGQTTMMGEIVIVPQTDELKSLHEYLVRACKAPTSANGSLLASFVVKKDGSITNLATSKQLSKAVREEVLKTLKSAPKWDAFKIRYEQPYSLYLTFKNGKIMPYLNEVLRTSDY